MSKHFDRRELLQTSASLTGAFMLAPALRAAGSDTLRIGLVGCGGRGQGAILDCLASSPGIELVALGDVFEDRAHAAHESLRAQFEASGHGAAFKVEQARVFVGFDNYMRVIESGIDALITATPPHFRPRILEAAVAAGKHVFMEKPVAVDGQGVRRVIAAGELAKHKGLAIVSGTQRRHQSSYMQAIQRIHDGAIGKIVGGQCWWNQGSLWMHPRQSTWSDVEWQLRNWLYFTWLSGDHIVEQHIHNLDVINWALQAYPESCSALGGREVRTDPAYGNVFDHFAVQYEYPGGVLIDSQCRQIDNCANRVGERLVGTLGQADPSCALFAARPWKFDGDQPNPYVQEQADWIASIRSGAPLNEAEQVAKSTLTAIMGRMAAYTGQRVSFEQALQSQLKLGPESYALGEWAVEEIAVPGETPLV